tara:strand:- start:1255 stop:1857 length:603 start_codon:yes stop_codon:yes gene_type:complete
MEHWKSELNKNGFVHIPKQDHTKLNDIIAKLGNVIMETDVKVNVESRSLVTSKNELDFHTDHHKAKYIIWFCHKQTSNGGHSIAVNAEKIYYQLTKEEQEELKKIELFEHKVFPDDKRSIPLVSEENGRLKFYYSFWLVNEEFKNNQALKKFRELISNSKYAKVLLKENDVFIVNNHTSFHGRTEIKGSTDRYLKRYWIN